MAFRGGPREEQDVWGWRAPDDGLEYRLEDCNGSQTWRCVFCNAFVTEGHLTSTRHLRWVAWAAEHQAGANPWAANANAAAGWTTIAADAGRQLAVADHAPPRPPPPPAAGATATSEQLQQQSEIIQQLQAKVEAQNKTIDEMQGEVKATLQQQSEQLQQQSKMIQQLQAMVEAQKKSIEEMQKTLWWWKYEAPAESSTLKEFQ